MALSLTTKLMTRVISTLSNPLDLVTGTAPLDYTKNLRLESGVGANQSDRVFSDTRTINASSNEDLDLAGSLVDAFGNVTTFARVKTLIISAASTNVNNLVIGNATSNGFITWVGGATHTVTVRPGGLLMLSAPDATAYAVTAGTGDLLRVANSGAGTAVTYDIIVIGASA